MHLNFQSTYCAAYFGKHKGLYDFGIFCWRCDQGRS